MKTPRYCISEMEERGGGGWKTGNRRGYKTADEAVRIAEKLAKKTGFVHCVELCEFLPDGEREIVDVVGYFPEN